MISNSIKTIFLLTGMTLIFMLIGSLIGGRQGIFIAFICAAGINFFSYWYSDQIVLKMYKAREVNSLDFPEVYQSVQKLSLKAGIPFPRIFVMDQDIPNAFATGRNEENAVIALTIGLIKIMNKEELSGVLAHELAHIKNKDILIGTIVATMAGAITMLASMARWSAFFGGINSKDDNNEGIGFLGLFLTSILAPLAAAIIQMAISRTREYSADLMGATIAGNSKGLVNALQKLENFSGISKIDADISTAHMFIVSPLSSGKKIQNLFSTHPPIKERIRRLLGITDKQNNISKDIEKENAAKAFWNHLNGR